MWVSYWYILEDGRKHAENRKNTLQTKLKWKFSLYKIFPKFFFYLNVGQSICQILVTLVNHLSIFQPLTA